MNAVPTKPPKAKKLKPAAAPTDSQSLVSAAYNRLVNQLRPQLRVHLSLVPAELRELYAANVAIHSVSVILGCHMKDTAPYLEMALRPGTYLVDHAECSREARLAALAVNASAFFYMMRAGHEPGAVLAAIKEGLDMDHTFGNAPDCASVFLHAKRPA